MSNITLPDGTLNIVQWANDEGLHRGGLQALTVSTEDRPVAMAHSNATGLGLVSNGKLGADLIQVVAGDGFVPHTHPGDHLLIIVAGQGTITYGGKIYPTHAGQIYMVEGYVPHAVGAITDHVLLSVGCPHKPIDSLDRMVPVEYQAVLAEVGSLHCLICDKAAIYPTRLHDLACPHCPCEVCNPVIDRKAGHHA